MAPLRSTLACFSVLACGLAVGDAIGLASGHGLGARKGRASALQADNRWGPMKGGIDCARRRYHLHMPACGFQSACTVYNDLQKACDWRCILVLTCARRATDPMPRILLRMRTVSHTCSQKVLRLYGGAAEAPAGVGAPAAPAASAAVGGDAQSGGAFWTVLCCSWPLSRMCPAAFSGLLFTYSTRVVL